MRTCVLLAAGSMFALACSSGDQAEPAPARIRLVEVPEVTVVPAPAEPTGTLLFAEDFSAGSSAWSIATDSAHPLRSEEGILSVSASREEVPAFVTLSGSRGFLYRLVEVEPNTVYLFEARVRQRELRPSIEPYFGGTTWLAELDRTGSVDELMVEGPEEWVVARHLFDSVHGQDGWQQRTRLIQTGPETRSLLVALNLCFFEGVESGAVDFTDVQLARVPLARHWEASLERARADVAAGEPPATGWRAERVLRGHLGAEVRPSIICFPGERLRFRLTLPGGSPQLETGIGAWSRALLTGTGRAQSFSVKLQGNELITLDHPASTDPADARWRDVTVDLSRWAGRTVELELGVDGDLPGVFGAPTVRDTAAAFERPNLLLISIDTLRADHVGSYGAPRDPTPHLDALAGSGVRFAHVDGQAPYTLPGHASMLSGQVPSVHGVQRTTQILSSVRSPILARILAAHGYRTQAFTGGGFVNADFGFDKGFDGFANIDPLRQRDAAFFRRIVENDPGAMRRMLRADESIRITQDLVDENGPERIHAWLADHVDEPFFLFVHTYSVHDYDPPAAYLDCHERGCTSTRTDYEEHRLSRKLGWNPQPISDADRDHLAHLYEAALRYTDELVGDLLERLEALGLAERTIVAVATDHGEEMFERGFMQHGKTLYEELTRLPMIVRVPGAPARVVEEPAMLVDLAPTLLGALGIPRDERMQGQDLLGPGRTGDRITWSEIHDDFVHKYALRAGDGWKLIHAPPDPEVDFPAAREWELFDLSSDAEELTDLSASEPERLGRMRAELERHRSLFDELGRSLGEIGTATLDENTRRQLEELGYF